MLTIKINLIHIYSYISPNLTHKFSVAKYWQWPTNDECCSIPKQYLSACGYATVVSSSIRDVDVLLRETVDTATLTLTTPAVVGVNDSWMGISWSWSEPEHSEVFCSGLSENFTLQCLWITWVNWVWYWGLDHCSNAGPQLTFFWKSFHAHNHRSSHSCWALSIHF